MFLVRRRKSFGMGDRVDRLHRAILAARRRAARAETLAAELKDELAQAERQLRAAAAQAERRLRDAADGRLRGVVRDMSPGPDVAAMLAMGVAIREVAQADVPALREVLRQAEETEGAPLYGWRAWLDLLAEHRPVAALALEELAGSLNSPEGIEAAASLSALHRTATTKPAGKGRRQKPRR
jgi:hypothetical protein